MSSNHLAPPRPGYVVNPDHIVPLSPPSRPPFAHYHSSSSLPITPQEHHEPPPRPFTPSRNEGLRPYLTLGPRLFLTTLSPALIPFILTIAHLVANRSSTSDMANSLRANMLSACSGLAKGAATLQTLPRYLAMQTNEGTVRATQASIRAMGAVLMDMIMIMEKVVIFMMDTYRSLLMCTIELAVRGTLELLIGAVREVTDAITTSLNAIRTSIQEDISSANKFIQEAVSKINTATSLIGVSLSIPEFSVPSLSALQDVKVSNDLETSLLRLNQSIPSLTELRDKLSDLIEKPFALLKTEINSTRLELAAGFNTSILPTPPLSALSAQNSAIMEQELCGDLDTSLVDNAANALRKLSSISIGLMILLLFLVWATLCFWEWRRWKATKDAVETIEYEWQRDPASKDAWRVVSIVEHPVLEKYSSPALKRMARNERTQANIRWYLSYLSHPTCLALLFVALLGFLSLHFQILALNAIKSNIRANANATVSASTNQLSTRLNAMAANASQEYARDFNAAVAGYQSRVDQELFGKWVNTTGVALNNTLVTFYDDVEKVVMQAFGGTILYNPMNTFMYCILGSKIDSLSSALTWLRDHAHVTLPTIPDTILLLSPEAMNEIAGPVSAAAVGSSPGHEADEGIVGDLIRHAQKAIEFERNVYAILLGVWGLFALVGLFIVIWHSGGRERYTKWRGSSVGQNGAEKPWSKNGGGETDDYGQKHFRGASSFTPNPPEVEGRGSFFNYKSRLDADNGHLRPIAERKSTLGSGISSLFAPAERFLNLGRKSPLPLSSPRSVSALGRRDVAEKEGYEECLVDRNVSSERYNSAGVGKGAASERYSGRNQGARDDGDDTDDLPTPPPFWVNRFYGGSDDKREIFPTRGQKHGQAVAAASNIPSATKHAQTPIRGIESDSEDEAEEYLDHRYTRYIESPSATSTQSHDETHSQIHSRSSALQDQSTSAYQHQHQQSIFSAQPVYPRPMSRASTLEEGESVPVVARKMPAKNPFTIQVGQANGKKAAEPNDPYADRYQAKRFAHVWRGDRV